MNQQQISEKTQEESIIQTHTQNPHTRKRLT
jgi:hypothetical protein